MRGQTSSNHRQSSDSDFDGTAVVDRDGHGKVGHERQETRHGFRGGRNSRLRDGSRDGSGGVSSHSPRFDVRSSEVSGVSGRSSKNSRSILEARENMTTEEIAEMRRKNRWVAQVARICVIC